MKFTKEQLYNTKIRVETPDISENVIAKLESFGFYFKYIPKVFHHYLFIDSHERYQVEYSINHEYFKESEYKEILASDLLNEGADFESWSELYGWVSKCKIFYHQKKACEYRDGRISFNLRDDLSSYKKHLEPPKPKEIKLFAYKVFTTIATYGEGNLMSRCNGHEIRYLSGIDLLDLHEDGEHWKRSPEYDWVIK